MDQNKLRKLYGRLKGIKEAISIDEEVVKEVGDDYNRIVSESSALLGEDLNTFLLRGGWYYESVNGGFGCYSSVIRGKLLQFLSFLEHGQDLFDQVVEIGSIYNSITDPELKARCSDILSAPSNFDRVINQATLVLEDRIRSKSKLTGETGVQLVNRAINSEVSKSVLKLSDD